jgi:hypothetical protein
MLAYILAILVGGGSVGLYVAAFFFPEIHRKNDFIWSGVGFFYALFLWIYARQVSGGILVGQMASVALMGWFAWQTVKLRRQIVPTNQQTPLPGKTKVQPQLDVTATPKIEKPPAQIKPQPPAKIPTAPATTPKVVPPTTSAPTTPPTKTPTVKPQAIPTPPATTPPPPPAPVTDDSPEDTEPWIKLELTTPPNPPSKPLGQAIQPPNNNPLPKPEINRSVPSQPDSPLPPLRTPEVLTPKSEPPEILPDLPQTDNNQSSTPPDTST